MSRGRPGMDAASPAGNCRDTAAAPPPDPACLTWALYDETMVLLEDARHYAAAGFRGDIKGTGAADTMMLVAESLRVTTRLGEVMAWLMNQLAAATGEFGRERLLEPDRRLGGRTVCRGEVPDTLAELSPRLAALLARTRSLFDRIDRLDALLGAVVAPSPVDDGGPAEPV